MESVDGLLSRVGLPVLLLSPQGVVFSSARPEWLFAVAPPLTQARIDSIRATRQFGSHFDNGLASELPFSLDASHVVLNGVPHAISRRAVDWKDPGGQWQLLMLDDVSGLMPWSQRLQVGLAALMLFSMLGWLLLDLLRSRAQVTRALERFKVLGTALESSPVAVVITDSEGFIEWVNPQYERNCGYTLEEVKGRKPSVVASGQTPPATYQAMWGTLLSGQSWRGTFINQRRDGSIYHDEVTLSPVFDERGKRIAIVGLQEDVSERMRAQAELQRREQDPGRFDGVEVLGVDEHLWHHVSTKPVADGGRGPKELTGMVDLTRDATGRVRARLLDLVPGRSSKAYADWIKERDEQFRAGVKIAALDPFAGYKKALDDELDDATAVLDAFHVVKLGTAAVDEVRRRVQQDTLGHRGRTGDPLYGIQTILRAGAENLTDKQRIVLAPSAESLDHSFEFGCPANQRINPALQCQGVEVDGVAFK